MARPNREFLLAWSSLSASEQASGWNTIAIPSSGPIYLRAGRRSPDNAEAVLLGFPSARLGAAEKLPEGQGFAVERADPEGDGGLWLALTRRAAGSVELFTTMVCDVAGVLDDSAASGSDVAQLLRIFIGRVGAWQEFMRKGSQALSTEAEIGLAGELLILGAIIESGVPPASAVAAWVGPLDGIQDFAIGTGAIEVKSTISVTGFTAKIQSLDQLDDSVRQPLFLACVRFHQAEGGVCLPVMIEAIRALVMSDAESARLLTERLLAAGYFDAHADRYIRRFVHSDTQLVQVKDSFPRLVPGRVPTGISRATYEIDLDKVPGDRIDIVTTLKKLKAL